MQRLKAKESEEEEEEEVEEEEEEEEVSSSTSSEVRKFGDWGRSHNHRACLLEYHYILLCCRDGRYPVQKIFTVL